MIEEKSTTQREQKSGMESYGTLERNAQYKNI